MIDSKILNLKPNKLSSKDISYNLIYKQLESNSLLITIIKITLSLNQIINVFRFIISEGNMLTNKTYNNLSNGASNDYLQKNCKIVPSYLCGLVGLWTD